MNLLRNPSVLCYSIDVHIPWSLCAAYQQDYVNFLGAPLCVILAGHFSVQRLLIYEYLVQEFLALPRADAIHLLAQYNGNAETVIQQIFA